MNIIKGKQAKVYLRISGTFYPVFCATECSYQMQFQDVLVTTRTSGKFRSRVSGLGDWGISVTGLTKIDNSDGQIAFLYLVQQGVRGKTVYVKMEFTDDDGNSKTIEGWVLVLQSQITATVGGFATATQYFPGDGAPLLDVVDDPVPDDLYKLYLATTEGAHEVSDADLAGATEIMLVEREDGGYTLIASGTPSGRQVKYTDNTTDGTLSFDSSLPFNAGEIVYVLYKKPA